MTRDNSLQAIRSKLRIIPVKPGGDNQKKKMALLRDLDKLQLQFAKDQS